MSESQFDKLLNTLGKAREENKQLKADNERLRRLLKECQEYVEAGMSSVDSELCDRIEREVGK